MSECYCPYCDFPCGDHFDDCYDSDTEYEAICPKCGKTFIFSIDYDPTFSTHKAPCLNGGEHNYEKVVGYPEEYFKNKFRCAYCGKEIKKEAVECSKELKEKGEKKE